MYLGVDLHLRPLIPSNVALFGNLEAQNKNFILAQSPTTRPIILLRALHCREHNETYLQFIYRGFYKINRIRDFACAKVAWDQLNIGTSSDEKDDAHKRKLEYVSKVITWNF